MKVLGVEFAPLDVPLKRRLQTLAVTAWLFATVFGSTISWLLTIFILVYCNNFLKLLMIGYLLFVYYDWDTRLTGRSKKWCISYRNSAWWRYLCDYFPINIHKTVDLDPTKNYLFCSFPHGFLATGVGGAFGTNGRDCAKIFPGLDFRLVTLDSNFRVPFYREYVLSFGLGSVDAKGVNYLLSHKPTENDGPTEDPVTGRAVVLVVGGAAEAFKCKPRTYHLVVKRRKGFVKIALKNGASLVPVFSFGETDLYDQVNNPEGSLLRKFQELFKKFTGIAPILPVGRGIFQYSFGLVPNRKPINVVVGAPLEIPKIEEPTKEQIEEYHTKFIERLIDLFETHKSKYLEDYENIKLVLDE